MPGVVVIIVGVVLAAIVFFLPVLYIPAGMVFGVMTSMDWAKQVAEAAGVSIGDLYLWFAAGIVICLIFSRGESGWGPGLISVPSSLIILSLFVIFGLLQFEGPAAYIAQTVMPLINSWSVRVGVLLLFAVLPIIWIVYGFLYS